MRRIQEIRITLGMAVPDFAKALGVSEQLIGRWESGDAEPDITVLRDIATLLGTNVDAVIEFDICGRRMASQHWVPGESPLFDGFWGRIGLQLPGYRSCRWFPITFAEYTQVMIMLSTEQPEPHWLVVSTLNNRKLIINPALMRRIRLLDDAAERPEDDAWHLGWESEDNLTPELYRALGEYFWDEHSFDTKNSPSAQDTIQALVTKHELDSPTVMDRIGYTHVHLENGSTTAIYAANADIYNLVLDAYAGMPLGISLCTKGSRDQNHFPPQHVVVIDIPLLQFQEAEAEACAQMEGA
jgi:transcriptional regulator with XRE-family HTH domain